MDKPETWRSLPGDSAFADEGTCGLVDAEPEAISINLGRGTHGERARRLRGRRKEFLRPTDAALDHLAGETDG